MNVESVNMADSVSLGEYISPKGYLFIVVLLNDTYPEAHKLGMLRPIQALRTGLRLVYYALKGLCFKK